MSYGYCPQCGAPGTVRDRSPNGNTVCENGHSVKSTVWNMLQDGIRSTEAADTPEPTDQHCMDREPSKIRIEALRAASRIVAGDLASGALRKFRDVDGNIFAQATLYLAEHFVKWLEGER